MRLDGPDIVVLSKIVFHFEFKQPLLPGDAGWPSLKFVLGVSSTGSLAPTTYSGTMDTAGSGTNVYAAGPYNNVGIPGIRCIDYIMPGYATANPYAARLVNSPMQTALAMATSKPATFYTVWLGANDVLGYATGGGVGTVNTGVSYPTATNNISSTTFWICWPEKEVSPTLTPELILEQLVRSNTAINGVNIRLSNCILIFLLSVG